MRNEPIRIVFRRSHRTRFAGRRQRAARQLAHELLLQERVATRCPRCGLRVLVPFGAVLDTSVDDNTVTIRTRAEVLHSCRDHRSRD